MKKKEDRRIAMTKRMLKSALIEMLEEKDIYHISIRELCENADVNRTTFYKYYGSQFDLLMEMERDLLENIEAVLASQKDYSKNAIEQILIYLENDIDFIRLLINSNVDPDFPQKLFSLSPIQRLINELISTIPEDEYDYFYRFLLFGAYEIVRTWVNKDERESPEWLAALLFKFILLKEHSITARR